MSQTMKAIDAGPLHMEFLHPRLSAWDSDRERQEKRKLTGLAQQKINSFNATLNLACLMAVNFSPGDPVLELDFDDAHLPADELETVQLFDNFIRRLRRARGKQELPLRCLAVTEHRHGDGRWHLHALINGVGDMATIRKLWKYGGVWATPFRMGRYKNAVSLARYFTKERKERVGQKRWMRRGTLRPPEVQSWQVSDDRALRLPRQAVELERSSTINGYGKFEFLFCIDKDTNAGRRRNRLKVKKRTPDRAV